MTVKKNIETSKTSQHKNCPLNEHIEGRQLTFGAPHSLNVFTQCREILPKLVNRSYFYAPKSPILYNNCNTTKGTLIANEVSFCYSNRNIGYKK